MEPWQELLRGDERDAAWDAFLDRYRPLIFSAIRHYVSDQDDVMDVFAEVCEALRDADFARLRRRVAAGEARARFSTWLVAVVRNRTVDWLRRRDGRPRPTIPSHLTPLQQQIFKRVILEGRTHRECFHLLTMADGLPLTEHEFAAALPVAYRAASAHVRIDRAALRRAGPLPPDLAVAEPDPEMEDSARRLVAALQTLTPEDRLAVQLFVVDDLSAADVARVVGWPSPRIVYNRVGRALQALRVRMRDRESGS